MKLYKLKTRLIFSTVVGLIGFALGLIYMLIAEVRLYNAIGISNLMEAFYNYMRLIESFLLFFAISLIITSLLVLTNKQKAQRIFVSLTLGVAIILVMAIPEIMIRQKVAQFHKIKENDLSTVEVVELYEQALKKGDIKSLSNIAVHPNLPDSIQEILSDSESVEVRKSIAFQTQSEKILRKLSTDKEWEIRMAVAINKSTTYEIFERLRNDSNEDVRNTVNAISQAKK